MEFILKLSFEYLVLSKTLTILKISDKLVKLSAEILSTPLLIVINIAKLDMKYGVFQMLEKSLWLLYLTRVSQKAKQKKKLPVLGQVSKYTKYFF